MEAPSPNDTWFSAWPPLKAVLKASLNGGFTMVTEAPASGLRSLF